MAAAASFWYVWIPRNMPADLLFLTLLGMVYLSKGFDLIYGKPFEHVALGILGKLMWIRVAIMAILSLRSADDGHAVQFSFPRRENGASERCTIYISCQ